MRFNKICRELLAISLVVCFFCQSSAFGEVPQPNGVVDGVYRRDPWGVGHFGGFIVHPDLHETLAKYKGRSIQVEGISTDQMFSKGLSIITAIGKVSAGKSSPIVARLKMVPANPPAGTPFQLVCHLSNTSNKPLSVDNNYVSFHLRKPVSVDKPLERSFLTKQYTRGQLAIDEQHVQMFQCLVKTSEGGYGNLSRAGGLVIPPGETFPLVILFDQGVSSGKYEFGAVVSRYCREREQYESSWSWRSADVKGSDSPSRSRAPTLRALRQQVENLDEVDYKATVTLGHVDRKPWRIVRCGSGFAESFSGRLRAFDQDGKEIELEIDQLYHRISEPEPWRLMDVSEEGVQVKVAFRKRSRFSTRRITRFSLEVLTESGVETLVLTKDFDDQHVAPPIPFGDITNGVKLRIRPTASTFRADESIKFHLQAVNALEKPIVWWWSIQKIGQNTIVEIDGKRLPLPEMNAEYIGGWAAQHTCKAPVEGTVTLPTSLQLTKGQHTLRYTIVSDGGDYKNARNRQIPIVRGRIVSNQITFNVE